MALNIWPYEVKTTCDFCRDVCEPDDLWHLFEGDARTSGDIVCVNCIPQDSWTAWTSENRATDAANIMAWLLDGSPEAVGAAEETLVKVRESYELDAMRARLIARNLESRTFENPAAQQRARDAVAGMYRTWTRQQLEAELAEAPAAPSAG